MTHSSTTLPFIHDSAGKQKKSVRIIWQYIYIRNIQIKIRCVKFETREIQKKFGEEKKTHAKKTTKKEIKKLTSSLHQENYMMAFNSTVVGTTEQQASTATTTSTATSGDVQLIADGTPGVVESSVLFQWVTVAESSTFGLIWLTAVIGNGLITCTLLRRGLLTHPSNR